MVCSLVAVEKRYLKGDLVKVEAVTHVVVCTDRLRIVVHHDGFITHLK